MVSNNRLERLTDGLMSFLKLLSVVLLTDYITKEMRSNAVSANIWLSNKDGRHFTNKCYTIEKNSCMIHRLCKEWNQAAPFEMCELYNLFREACNTKHCKILIFVLLLATYFKIVNNKQNNDDVAIDKAKN